MIKLIASDLDGTILQNGAQRVDESLIRVIEKLVQKGIIFAPASGRQYPSLRKLFEPISRDLMFIAENGALVLYKDEIILKRPMERSIAMEIIEDIYRRENCEVLASGVNVAYIKPKSKEYYRRMTSVVNYDTRIVDSFDEIEEDIIKISVCDMSGIENSERYFSQRWNQKVKTAVSGDQYQDFTALGVSKGTAMKEIQEKMSLSPDECMAFGDNYNDIEMLENVKYSYAMEKAVDEIKTHAKYTTDLIEKTLKDKIL